MTLIFLLSYLRKVKTHWTVGLHLSHCSRAVDLAIKLIYFIQDLKHRCLNILVSYVDVQLFGIKFTDNHHCWFIFLLLDCRWMGLWRQPQQSVMTTTRSLFIRGDCAQEINGGLMKCSGNVAHKINQILFIDISYYDISVFSFIKDRSSARDKRLELKILMLE